ncbi:ATPase family AAA domain-containing protein 1 isoform X1 [Rhinatrema bivittatum]|uniref:ATPase family AAA domain-containing protein 1 isoform X1 n=2 Tax=Rhinatrema bivittatum TaxID=194408 RepID=UPI00112A9551|nr:ATPase family AAA domain-containing protein 1 isoform X1 [Rhinatrema bivittatum]
MLLADQSGRSRCAFLLRNTYRWALGAQGPDFQCWRGAQQLGKKCDGLMIKMVHAEAFSRPLSRNEVVGLIFRLTIFGAVTYFTIKWMVDAIDPTRKQKVEAQKQAEKLMKQIGVKNVKLTEYEMSIAAHLVDPLSMQVTWSDIAGLDEIITDLKDTVILPIRKKRLFENSRLLQPPKGVLLYGPPGCGKTLIAKATAKEAGCRFINLQPSTLTDKWYGESQKLAAAVFSLAIKLQPSVIFIDEIDSFLRNRSSSDHEATAMMKAQFMSLWDGLDTDFNCQVIVMGATNRPQDLDSAIMRRMPTRFHINQPALKQREAILKLILKNENVDKRVDLQEIAKETDGFSGSDLKEMCRDAALLCVREYIRCTSEDSHDEDDDDEEIRPIQQQDLHRAIQKMKKSKDMAFQNVLMHVSLD